MNALDVNAAAARARDFYENLAPGDVDRLADVYAPNAYFRDPFNEVRGIPEIRRIFGQMFEQLADCRFKVLEMVVDHRGAMLTWDMTFRMRRYRPDRMQTIHGATHLKFDPAGRIVYHRDYWDAAEELYEKLPVIGTVMRWFRRRLG